VGKERPQSKGFGGQGGRRAKVRKKSVKVRETGVEKPRLWGKQSNGGCIGLEAKKWSD